MAKVYDFDAYLAEARATPYVLRVSEEQTITIEPPNAETMLLLDEAGNARRQLELLCGDQWQTIFGLVRAKHTGVLNKLALDMFKHFGVDQAVSGGGRAS